MSDDIVEQHIAFMQDELNNAYQDGIAYERERIKWILGGMVVHSLVTYHINVQETIERNFCREAIKRIEEGPK